MYFNIYVLALDIIICILELINNAYHTTPGIDLFVVLDTVATDKDRKFLLNLQICNLHREETVVLSLLPFILCTRGEIKRCDLRGVTRVL